MRWEVTEARSNETRELANVLQVSPITAQILWNRGIQDEKKARLFLNSQLRDLSDPFLLPGMLKAVERTWQALEKRESIVLYGDYDVDGVTSVAFMHRVLKALGASSVRPFLPDRFDEGYGLTLAGIERCLAEGKPDLLIVLDCGTNSCSEVSHLLKQGIDVVILDHHEPSLPADPFALVNYKLDQPNETSEYCTAGLVFKFCHGLLKLGRKKSFGKIEDVDLKSYLDLVALATVADIAPLTGENRILAKHGLKQMGKTQLVGLRALMRVAGIAGDPTGYDCGFKLGPRLNAAGRLESAMASLQLLLSNDENESDHLARRLDSTNRERQAEEARVWTEARSDAEAQLQDTKTRVLVLSRPGWHEGVVGIVASRIAREFYLPTFVIAINEGGRGKGSGRSIEGFNLAAAIEKTRSFLLAGGGHAMAAGISVESAQIEKWRAALQAYASDSVGLNAPCWKRVVRADVEVDLSSLDFELMEELQKLEPCGTGNPRPLLMARKVEVVGDPRTVGSEGKHLKLWLRQNGVTLNAIAFGRGGLPIQKGSRLDLIFELETNVYQGNKQLQLNIRELAEAKS